MVSSKPRFKRFNRPWWCKYCCGWMLTAFSAIFGVLCSAYRPHSQRQSCQCVSVSLWGREDAWHEDFWQVVWVLVIPSCFVGHCCFCRVVVVVYQIAAVFSVFGKFWRAFHRKLAVFVQGKLCSISKLLSRAVYDLFSFRKLTALLCLVCSLIFHSGVAVWSFLGITGVL